MKKLCAFIGFRGEHSWYVYSLIVPGVLCLLSAILAALRSEYPDNSEIQSLGIWFVAGLLLYSGVLITWTSASMLRSVWHDPEESTRFVPIQDPNESHHAKTQAIIVLAMATAALGFGLFESRMQLHGFADDFCKLSIYSQYQLTALIFGVSYYFATIKSVHVILMQDFATWRDVARRPLMGMGAVMMYLVVALAIDFFA